MNKLFNNDSLEIMKEMINKGEKVDCIITDPPYTLQEAYFGSGEGTGGFLSNNKANGENINDKIGFDTNMSYGTWLPLAYEEYGPDNPRRSERLRQKETKIQHIASGSPQLAGRCLFYTRIPGNPTVPPADPTSCPSFPSSLPSVQYPPQLALHTLFLPSLIIL